MPVATAKSLVSLASLPPGQYLIVGSLDNPDAFGEAPLYSVFALALDGKSFGPIAVGPGPGSALSPDGTRIAFPSLSTSTFRYTFTIVDLNSHSISTIPGDFTTDLIAWSPDGTDLLTSDAPSSRSNGLEVWAVDIATGERTQLTACQAVYADASCYNAAWSPSGAILELALASGDQLGSPETGNYLLDAGCLDAPAECLRTARGPLRYGEAAAWSPDSSHLAFDSGDTFAVLDTSTMRVERLPVQAEAAIESYAWSPEGDMIAFTEGDDDASVVHLVHITSGVLDEVPRFMRTALIVIGWSNAPSR